MLCEVTVVRKALEAVQTLDELDTLRMLLHEVFLERHLVSKPLVAERTLRGHLEK